jgi:DNA-binding XRE family transcriptional regulator
VVETSAEFGLTLRRVRDALRLSQPEFGARLGVSRRTLTRWECHDELPPPPRRLHVALSFPDVPVELRVRLARSMGIDEALVAPPPAPAPAGVGAGAPRLPRSAADAAAVDSAFLALCERADVAPGRLRAALAAFLERAGAAGLPPATIAAHLASSGPPPAMPAGPSATIPAPRRR